MKKSWANCPYRYIFNQATGSKAGKDISTCHFDGDDSEQTLHLGAFVDKRLVSVASFYFNKSTCFDSPGQYQLRGMATLPDFRGQGYSSELLKFGFPLIKRNFCDLVWCNARINAIDFYKKVGFESVVILLISLM